MCNVSLWCSDLNKTRCRCMADVDGAATKDCWLQEQRHQHTPADSVASWWRRLGSVVDVVEMFADVRPGCHHAHASLLQNSRHRTAVNDIFITKYIQIGLLRHGLRFEDLRPSGPGRSMSHLYCRLLPGKWVVVREESRIFESCCLSLIRRNSVLEELRVRFAVIQKEICCRVFCEWMILEWNSDGWKERKSCVSSAYRWWFKDIDETRVLSGVVYVT